MTHQPPSQEDEPLPNPEGERNLPHVPETDGPEQEQAPRHLQAEFHQDRLPTPVDLRELDDILPGAADRILALTEERSRQSGRAQDQNHTKAMALLQSRQQLVRRVQWMAFVVALLLVIVLLILATVGLLESTTSWGMAIAIGVLAAVVGRFLWNFGKRYAQSHHMEGRQTDATPPRINWIADLFSNMLNAWPRASGKSGTRGCVEAHPKISCQGIRVMELMGICKKPSIGPHRLCGQDTPNPSVPDKPLVRTDCRTRNPQLQAAARHAEVNELRVGSRVPVWKYL